MSSPLALVLSGGGARAAYQVGVLRAIGELAPEVTFPIITGVSAGAINTVSLAAHPGSLSESVRHLEDCWRRLTSDRVYQLRAAGLVGGAFRLAWHALTGRRTGPPAVRGLLSTEPLRRFVAHAVDLYGIQRNIEAGRLRAAALSATSYTTGWTVTFVHGAPEVEMWSRAQRMAVRQHLTLDHVLGSAAIPLVFPAMRIGAEYFGDGSVRQAAPLAPAIHLGAARVVAIGMRAARPAVVSVTERSEYPSSAEVFGLLLNSVFLDSLDVDSERLERINRVLELVPPNRNPPSLRHVELLAMRPSRDLGEMAGGYRTHLPRTLEFALGAIGGRRSRAADLRSYLMFEPAFTSDLIELGYRDTVARRGEVVAFLQGGAAS